MKCIVCGFDKRRVISDRNRSLFCFPKFWRLRDTWLKVIRNHVAETIRPKIDRICEKHFNPVDIDRTGRQPKLKPNAVPTICMMDSRMATDKEELSVGHDQEPAQDENLDSNAIPGSSSQNTNVGEQAYMDSSGATEEEEANVADDLKSAQVENIDYETVLDGIQQPASIPTRTNNLKPVPITHHFESPPAADISHFQDRENTSLDRNSTSYVLDEIQRPVSRPVRNKRPVTRNKGLCVPKTYQRAKTETILKAVKKRRVSRKKEIVVPKKPKEITAPRNTKEKRTETILQAVDDKLECLSRNMREDEFDTFGKHVANQLRQLPLLNAIMCQNYINGFLAEERMKILNCGGMLNMNASTSNINPNSSEMRRIEDVMLEETSNNPRDISLECIEEESKFIIDLSDTLSEQSRSQAETTVQRPNFGNS